jgi:hypothetical protein
LRCPISNSRINLGSLKQHDIVHGRVCRDGHVFPDLVSEGVDLREIAKEAVYNSKKARSMDEAFWLPAVTGKSFGPHLRVPYQIVGIYVVLKELGDEPIKGRILWRRMLD